MVVARLLTGPLGSSTPPVHPANNSEGAKATGPAHHSRPSVRRGRDAPDRIAYVVCKEQSALFVLRQAHRCAVQL